MEKDILFETPHIKLISSNTELHCLIVEGTKLNDYIEDYLWDETEYQSTSVAVQDKSTTVIYSNYIDTTFPIQRLVELLQQLDLNEVERIYRLNN